jgi:hypothetical protein
VLSLHNSALSSWASKAFGSEAEARVQGNRLSMKENSQSILLLPFALALQPIREKDY